MREQFKFRSKNADLDVYKYEESDKVEFDLETYELHSSLFTFVALPREKALELARFILKICGERSLK